MNEEEAIRECKEMWLGEDGIEESGLSKKDFLDSPNGAKWRKRGYRLDCPLCEDNRGDTIFPICPTCPLVIQYGKVCVRLGFKGREKDGPQFFGAVRGLK